MEIPPDPGEINLTPRKLSQEDSVGRKRISPAKQVSFEPKVRINSNSRESALILKERVQGKFFRENCMEKSLIQSKKRKFEIVEQIPGGRTLETSKTPACAS